MRAGAEAAVQVLGTDNTGAEGDVFIWKNATVGGGMFVLGGLSAGAGLTVSGVNVLSELGAKQDTLAAGSGLVFHEKLLQDTKIKSLAPGANVELTSTSELVTISTSSNLTVDSLTPSDTAVTVAGGLTVSGPSQLQGIDASGLVAEQVVWVTGAAGAPAQSIMFPGSLALGKWRIRGDEPGTFILERFDDDGSLQTDGWRTVASFGHDPDTNVNRLFVDNLSVGGTDIMQGFENMEPAFEVEAPLQKEYDLGTGVTTLRVDTTGLGGSPWFAAGVVDGRNLSILVDQGPVSFTVSRLTNYPTGVYTVTFASNHPRGNNYVILVHSRSGNSYLTPPLQEAPTPQTAGYFHVTLRNTTATGLQDEIFHFSVLA